MPESKNILFITHHNNDFDHFLPLIVNLKKHSNIQVKNLAVYHKYILLQNKLHRYICKENSIEIDSITDIFYFKKINRAIIKIHKYILENATMSKKKELKSNNIRCKITYFQKPMSNTFLRYLQLLIEKYFAISSIFLLTKKNMIEYIEKNNIDFAIIDIRGIDEGYIDLNPIQRFILLFKEREKGSMDNLLFRFTKAIRDKNIPIFMMHHGPYPVFWDFKEKDILSFEKIFRPDYLVASNKENLKVYKNVAGLKNTFFLGDPRYDIKWVQYLQSCALKVYKNKIVKAKNRIVLLYLMDIFTFDRSGKEKNNRYKFSLQKDILSMVNEFENLEIWIKHHPRNPYNIPLDDFINKDEQENIKQFGNDVDTNVLMALSDISLATSSTTLINNVIQKKPAILYDRWKECLNATTIYDGLKYNASSREELKSKISKIINAGYTIEESYLNKFYEEVFSVKSSSISMTDLYIDKIKELIKKN